MIRVFIFLLFIISLSNGDSDFLKKVSVQFQWKHQFEYAGFYVAKEKGFYNDIGLDVELEEFEHGDDINEIVASSTAQYGILRPSSIVDISHGKDLIYLAAIYQTSPLIVLADSHSNIKKIEDFKGKTIMITEDHTLDSSLVAMFKSHSLDLKSMKILTHSFNPKSLLDGEADLMVSYISNEPYILKELGGHPVVFASQDYGFDFYDDFLTTSKKYFEQNRQEVKLFTEATLRGYDYAFNNIEESVELILKHYNSSLKKSKEALLYEAHELKKLFYYKTEEIGSIQSQKLQKMYDIYRLLGLADSGIDLDDVLYQKLISNAKLNKEEKEFLATTKNINVCISPEWSYPFHKENKNGKSIGIGVDYVNVLKKKLDINFNYINTTSWKHTEELLEKKICDLMPLTIKTKSKDRFSVTTSPYLSIPIVITTKKDINFVDGIESLKNKKVAIVKNRAYLRYFLKDAKYKLDTIDAESPQDGFELVNNGQAFAFIDALPSTIYELQNSHLRQNLKISGKFIKNLDIYMGVEKNDTILKNIIQKTLDSMSEKDKQELLDKWLPVEYEKKIDYAFIAKIILFFSFLIGLIIYWNRKIYYTNKLLQKSQKEIQDKNKQLEKLANTDKLTQLYNRTKTDEILKNELELLETNGYFFGICLLDVDFFKAINDKYGHQIGDKVLVELSNLLLRCIRASDSVGRWGGEEFLIIFSKIKEDDLKMVAEKIRIRVSEMKCNNLPNITVSLGVTLSKKEDNANSIIKRVDDALYKAKQSGRNRVVKL